MYDTILRNFHRPYMARGGDHIVGTSSCCARNGPKYDHWRRLPLFPASAPPDSVTMDFVGPFPKATEGTQYKLVIPDRYSKLTRAISTCKTTVTHIANILNGHWLIPYGITTYIRTENGAHLVSKIFATVRALLCAKHLTTFMYHHRQTTKPRDSIKPPLCAFDATSPNT